MTIKVKKFPEECQGTKSEGMNEGFEHILKEKVINDHILYRGIHLC